jgi:hypothetical protein
MSWVCSCLGRLFGLRKYPSEDAEAEDRETARVWLTMALHGGADGVRVLAAERVYPRRPTRDEVDRVWEAAAGAGTKDGANGARMPREQRLEQRLEVRLEQRLEVRLEVRLEQRLEVLRELLDSEFPPPASPGVLGRVTAAYAIAMHSVRPRQRWVYPANMVTRLPAPCGAAVRAMWVAGWPALSGGRGGACLAGNLLGLTPRRHVHRLLPLPDENPRAVSLLWLAAAECVVPYGLWALIDAGAYPTEPTAAEVDLVWEASAKGAGQRVIEGRLVRNDLALVELVWSEFPPPSQGAALGHVLATYARVWARTLDRRRRQGPTRNRVPPATWTRTLAPPPPRFPAPTRDAVRAMWRGAQQGREVVEQLLALTPRHLVGSSVHE